MADIESVRRIDPRSGPEVFFEQSAMAQNELFRFGHFELIPESGELRRSGVKIRLQGKPLQVLKALLERPGGVVTRDELRERMWTADTFVDFESGLNTAANRLRNALGDSAENPIYVETLPRIGYRFIAPVTKVKYGAASANPTDGASVTAARPPASAAAKIDSHDFVTTGSQVAESRKRSRWPLWVASSVIAVAALVLVAILRIGQFPKRVNRDEPSFQRITLQTGNISCARFTPDGKHVLYSAAWQDGVSHLFETDGMGPAAKDLGYGEAVLQSVSPTGSLAFWKKQDVSSDMVLSEVTQPGAEPHVLSRSYWAVDYGPNGALCFIKRQDSRTVVEFPPGHEVYGTTGWISNARISPLGDKVAFLNHPSPLDDAGSVMVVGVNGVPHTLSAEWGSLAGLSWNATGDEVWFTAAHYGTSLALMAVDLRGKTREVARTAGGLEIQDATHPGSVLVLRNAERLAMTLASFKQGSVRNVSRFDWSRPVAISGDGTNILFDESGEGGGRRYSVYLYSVLSGSFSRIGEGRAMDLSQDGQWALAQDVDDGTKLTLISTATQKAEVVSGQGLTYRWTRFLPGDKEILLSGNYAGKAAAVYRQMLHGGAPRPVEHLPDLSRPVMDRTGNLLISYVNSKLCKVDLKTGEYQTLAVKQRVSPVAILAPTRILVRIPDHGHLTLEVFDEASGKLSPYRRIPDPGSTSDLAAVTISENLQVAAYPRKTVQSELFAVKGWN